MSRVTCVFPIVAVLAAAGRSLTPPFHPDAPPPAARREGAVLSPSQGVPPQPVSAGWWQGFGSAELDGLVARAEADAQVRINAAALLPSLDVTSTVSRNKENVPERNKCDDCKLAGEAFYETDFWGRNAVTLWAAKETAIAATYDHEVVRLTAKSAVANTFFQLVEARARFGVAQQNLATAQAPLKVLQREDQVGTATLLDITQETAVASATATLPPLLQQQSQALDAIAILIGSRPKGLTLGLVSLDAFTLPAIAPGLPSELLRRHPDVSEGEAELLAANYDIANAPRAVLPGYKPDGGRGAESEKLAELFTPTGLIYDLIAQLTQPIFEGGRGRPTAWLGLKH